MRGLIEVRPSVLVDFLEFEYNIGLSQEETDAFASLLDKNKDGTISLVEWIEASKQFASSESFQGAIHRYVNESREKKIRTISFEESLTSHLHLLRERSSGKKAGINMNSQDYPHFELISFGRQRYIRHGVSDRAA